MSENLSACSTSRELTNEAEHISTSKSGIKCERCAAIKDEVT